MVSNNSAVRERPIIMSAESVRAILVGQKTQTRRVVKPQPPAHATEVWERDCLDEDVGNWQWIAADRAGVSEAGSFVRCPYGRPGDRLWVREEWGRPWHHAQPKVFYRADEDFEHPDFGGWQSPNHMPRWASRLAPVISSIRVERLQGISEADAIAEGVVRRDDLETETGFAYEFGSGVGWPEARLAFAVGWDALNAARGYSWSDNPWCWVVEFKRIEAK